VGIKPIVWVGSSKRDLLSLPEIVKDEIGFALYEAQKGEKSAKAKPFKGS
jgi:phage-related protein